MRVDKTKTRRGKRFLEERAPKVEENDKNALIVRGQRTSEMVNKALHELYMLKKPLAVQLQRKNQLHPFEDETFLCKFSAKFDASLFLFGSHSKKRPQTLTFGRMFDYQLLDMVEMRMERFVSAEEFQSEAGGGGVLLGVKPCIVLQGAPFEQDECMQRVGNLLIDWFRGTKTEHVRLQGMELLIALTAVSAERLLMRVYKTVLKKQPMSGTPQVELREIGPSIDFRIDRKKLASDALYKEALKKPKPIKKAGAGQKNVRFDSFGNKMASLHTGRQRTDTIQTRKVKALKKFGGGGGSERRGNVTKFEEANDEDGDEEMEE